MKNLIILSLLNIALMSSCASYKAMIISFSEPIVKTYDVNGNKDDLYVKANLWMVSAFNDARSVIQYSDKEEGIITGKYLLRYIPASSGMLLGMAYTVPEEAVYSIIEVRVKDGRAYISVTPESWEHTQKYDISGKPVSRPEEYTKEMAMAEIDALCESFYKSLQAESIKF